MFAGINMFWARLRLILARAARLATAAVNSLGGTVSDRLLKLHGRWKSDYAKDLYVQEDHLHLA